MSSSSEKKRTGRLISRLRRSWDRIPSLTKISIPLFLIIGGLFAFYMNQMSGFSEGKAPVFSMDSDLLEISVSDGEEVLLGGIRAADDRDGDLTGDIIVENVHGFVSDNERKVDYVVFDSDNHVSRISRRIRYTDYVSPRFSLDAPLAFQVGTLSILDHMHAQDCLDGDITSTIKIIPEDGFSLNVPGTYRVRFQAANSAGDVEEISCSVVVSDISPASRPRFRLKSCLVYVDRGSSFDPLAYPDRVEIGSREYEIVRGHGNYFDTERDPKAKVVVGTDSVKVENNVNTGESGSYEVRYSLTVDAGNQETVTGSCILPVIVR